MTAPIWDVVAAERARAYAKHGDKSMEAAPVDDMLRLSILTEEVGEVAKALNDSRLSGYLDQRELRLELIQVAAMAGAWADVLDPVCRICDGRGWKDHEGWSARFQGDRRVEGDGYMPCWVCNGDGDDPFMRQDAKP